MFFSDSSWLYQSQIDNYKRQIEFENRKKADATARIASARMSLAHSNSPALRSMYERSIADAERTIANAEQTIVTYSSQINIAEQNLQNCRRQTEQLAEQQRQQESWYRQCQIQQQRAELSVLQQQMQSQIQENKRLNDALVQMQQLPEELVVLFLASNPDTGVNLKLDEEARAIQENIRKAEFRDAIRFESRWAVRPLDVLQAINETNPVAIHFSGHGFETGELVFTDQNGAPKAVTAEAISSVVAASSERIRLFFFNACFSEEQAKSVTKHVDAAIGMTDSIGDKAARVFAAAFYSGVGFGKSVQEAFAQARAALLLEGIPEENTPRLFVKDGVNASQIVLVKETHKIHTQPEPFTQKAGNPND